MLEAVYKKTRKVQKGQQHFTMVVLIRSAGSSKWMLHGFFVTFFVTNCRLATSSFSMFLSSRQKNDSKSTLFTYSKSILFTFLLSKNLDLKCFF